MPSQSKKFSPEEEERVSFVKSLLNEEYGLQPTTIKSVGKAHYNHVYKITLSSPSPKSSSRIASSKKPGVSPIPAGTKILSIRMPKEGAALEDSIQVSNQVAITNLSRQALSSSPLANIIPLCFGWAEMSSGRGWILEEWMEGEPLDKDAIRRLSPENRQNIFNQIAMVVKAFQDYELPESLKNNFGGVSFDDNGDMVGCKMALPCGGPFSSYKGLLKGMCQYQLDASDRSDVVGGWKDSTLRSRIEKFLAEGLDKVLEGVPEERSIIIHGDLTDLNVHYNKKSMKLTALVDFDFSHLAAPISEYLLSFLGYGYNLSGSADCIFECTPREQLLKGEIRFDPARPDKGPYSKIFDNALVETGAEKPVDIKGAKILSDVWWFSQDICQAFWFMPEFLKARKPAKLLELKRDGERNLGHYLSEWGY